MTHRTDLRFAAQTAMIGAPRFNGMNIAPAWSQNLDHRSLPIWGTSVLRESSQYSAKDTVERMVSVVVGLKRTGGEDIENVLDLDAEEIEAAVWPSLAVEAEWVCLTQTEMDIAGEGEMRVGTLQMTFACMIFTDAPV